MAEETQPAAVTATEAPVGKKPKKKKSRPANCAQSNKRIRRKDWYYRDGKYFANKQCYKLFVEQESAKKEKEIAAAKAAAQAATSPPAATQQDGPVPSE